VLVNEDDLDRLGERMTQAGITLDEMWMESNPLLRGFQLRFQCQGVTIDLLRPRDLHDQEVFQRKRRRKFHGHYYWIVSPEDCILQKLKVGRPRDFEDAMSVVERSHKELDHAYLKHWARKLGVAEELDYIMAA
jgi:hypothetical protein